MATKINVEEILKNWGLGSESMKIHMKGAIKEIVEAVVDECAEEAEVDYFVEYGLGGEGTCCHSVKQESILRVKQMIDYETEK